MQHVERGVRGEELCHAVVGVLVDDDEAKASVGLPVQGVEERLELGGAVDRRDDKVEAEVWGGSRHRRRLPSAGRGHAARVRRPRRSRCRGDGRGSRRERPPTDGRGSRAGRGRRRLRRRHGRRARCGRGPETPGAPEREAAGSRRRAERRPRRRSGDARGANGRGRRRAPPLARARRRADTLPARLRRSSGPGRSTSTPAERSGGCTACPSAPGRFVGRRSSRRRSSIRPWSSTGPSSSGTSSGTTRPSRRARTTTSGRGCSTSRTATTSPRRSSSTVGTTRKPPRGGRSCSSNAGAGWPCGRSSRSCRISRDSAPSSHGAQEADWRFRRARRGRPPTPSASSWRRSRRDTADVRRAAPRPGRSLEARARRRRAWLSLARPSRSIRRCPWVRCAGWRGGGRPGPSAPLQGGSSGGPAPNRSASRWSCPEPTPYRTGMLDRLAERPDLDLTVVYAAAAVQRRAWGDRRASPRGASRRQAGAGRGARAPARLSAVRRHPRRATAMPTPTSWSSRAGARSLRRQRSPGAGGTASPTCSSSSRTSATPGRAGGGR